MLMPKSILLHIHSDQPRSKVYCTGLQTLRGKRSQGRNKENHPLDDVGNHPQCKTLSQLLKTGFQTVTILSRYQWNKQVILKRKGLCPASNLQMFSFSFFQQTYCHLKENQCKPRSEEMDDWQADESKLYLQIVAMDQVRTHRRKAEKACACRGERKGKFNLVLKTAM